MTDNTVIPYSLDDYFQSTPVGSIDKAIGNNLWGFNHRQIPGMVPSNKDSYGMTFFVRPQLNLQSDNVRNVRLFYPLLSNNSQSVQRYVRCLLDPRLQYGYQGKHVRIPKTVCEFVDERNAFIPILTNNLNSISGWPDVVSPVFQSKAGLYQEEYSQVDGVVKNFSSYDLTATFRNTRGDPIVYLFYIWLHYQSLVFEGQIVPYPDFIVENEIDYMTRIYRIILDPERRFVRKIGATGVSFPTSVPMGEFMDFNNDTPFNLQNKDISIRFKCLGAQYQDDILIDEFNKTVAIFNPDMSDEVLANGSEMIKIHPTLLNYFNNRGYPRINRITYELEWYVSVDTFKSRINGISSIKNMNKFESELAIDQLNQLNTGD